jgi:ABC-type antimicrobial peptide transport system permease subunit
VVADKRLEDPHVRHTGFVLLNLWQLERMADWGNLQVEFSGPTGTMESLLRQHIDRAGRQQIFLLSTLSQLRERSLLQDRLLVAIGNVYVLLTVTLAAVGLAGLLLFFVAARKKEFSIRIALGADLRNVNALVVREAMVLTGTGVLIGAPFAYLAIRTLSNLVYGVPPTLMYPVVSACAVLSTVAILAAVVPMRRAALINPNDALRTE